MQRQYSKHIETYTLLNNSFPILYFRLQVNELAAQRDRHGEHGVQEAPGRGQGMPIPGLN